MNIDILIIGGGAAGMAAALEANKYTKNILIIERDYELGGILNQCIHDGFGLKEFKENLTGPEYANKYINLIQDNNIKYLLNTTVINIKNNFEVTLSNVEKGIFTIFSKAIILTTGAYERTRGQIKLPGERPKGVLTAGSAQRYLNKDGYLVGKNVFILGSGDIGLIMARRMTLEGAKVLGIAEIMSYSNGLDRNIVQCLEDFNIPLYLSHTIKDIKGHPNLEEITIAKVDENFDYIENTEKNFKVDTLLLSVGLLPDVEQFNLKAKTDPKTKGFLVTQNYETTIKNLYAAGNALHIHDLVDDVSIEAKKAGFYAANELNINKPTNQPIKVETHGLINYVIPQTLNNYEKNINFSFRVSKKIIQAQVKIFINDALFRTRKFMNLIPAKMENIKIIYDDINNLENIKLVLEELS